MEQNQIPAPALPEYVCTKKVQAARIVRIEGPSVEGGRIWHLYLDAGTPGSFVRQPVTVEYITERRPEAGGYFWWCEGFASYASAERFEEEFARVPAMKPITLALVARQQQEAAAILAGTHPTLGVDGGHG